MNCQDAILYPALRLARVTGGPGRTASPDQTADALATLNRMVDSWDVLSGLIYSVSKSEWVLSPSKPMYSMGRASADFDADRPVRIDNLNVILYSGPAKTYLPIRILGPEEWAQIRARNVISTAPTDCWVDLSAPNANLWLWPIPTGAPGLEIWSWIGASQFQSESDEVSIPQGYLEAAVLNLAVKLSDQFGTQISPNIYADARKALGRVMAVNHPSKQIASWDSGTRSSPGSDGFNYLTGTIP